MIAEKPAVIKQVEELIKDTDYRIVHKDVLKPVYIAINDNIVVEPLINLLSFSLISLDNGNCNCFDNQSFSGICHFALNESIRIKELIAELENELKHVI